MIHEDAGQLVADSFVNEDCGNRAVDATRQATDYFFVANLIADLSDGLFTVGTHRPVATKARFLNEVFEKLCTFGCVVHLRVELYGVELSVGIGRDGVGRIG